MYSLSVLTVALRPVGQVRVCIGDSAQFSCSSSGVTWIISGFSTGISDANNPITAIPYARMNNRVDTDDDTNLADPSTLTFQQLGYADDNATVTCIDSSFMMNMTSTIQIGESAYNTYIRTYMHTCIGLLQHWC